MSLKPERRKHKIRGKHSNPRKQAHQSFLRRFDKAFTGRTAPKTAMIGGKKYKRRAGYRNGHIAGKKCNEYREAGWESVVAIGNDGKTYIYRRDPEAKPDSHGLFA